MTDEEWYRRYSGMEDAMDNALVTIRKSFDAHYRLIAKFIESEKSEARFQGIVDRACAGCAEAIEQLPDAARDYLDKAQDGVPKD